MQTDVSSEIKKTYEHLADLHNQIKDGVQLFDDEQLRKIVNQLHEDSNYIARHEHNMEKLKEVYVPLDSKLKKDILDTIYKILHSNEFTQALGTFQKELFPVLHRIESAIKKWKSKVENVKNDQMH